MLNREELRALCLKDPDAVIAIIEQLEARIVDLESRFNRNSHNSNNPPSSDRFRKTKSLRKIGIRHTGGQEGHKGTTLIQTETPDDIQNHEPDTCEHCGAEIIGNGYTNHCPSCLWSKHVDIHPGDREAGCKGMMKPTGIEGKEGEWVIVHTCEKCGYQKSVCIILMMLWACARVCRLST